MHQSSSRGVLLIGHGTRDTRGTAEFFQLSDRLAERLADDFVVRPCLLEFQQPGIAEAWESLMQCGCNDVTVAPLLLFSAGHAKSDIPGEVEAARSSTASRRPISIRYARAISREPTMLRAVRERLKETLVRDSSTHDLSFNSAAWRSDGRTAIVMVGRGSRDDCATTDMRVLSEMVVHGRTAGGSIASEFAISSDGLSTTFYAMAEPRLPETLEAVARSGNFDRIVVHPHLLFSGRLYDAIVNQVKAGAQRHPHVRFDVSCYLGPTVLVAGAIAARMKQPAVEQAISSPIAPLDA